MLSMIKLYKVTNMDKFIPDMYQKSIFTINYKKLKKRGIKCLLFDLDNTMVAYTRYKGAISLIIFRF